MLQLVLPLALVVKDAGSDASLLPARKQSSSGLHLGPRFKSTSIYLLT